MILLARSEYPYLQGYFLTSFAEFRQTAASNPEMIYFDESLKRILKSANLQLLFLLFYINHGRNVMYSKTSSVTS